MVSLRCKMLLQAELDKMQIPYKIIELGEADLEGTISEEQRDELNTALLKSGLELLDTAKTVLVERIKNVIIEMIHNADELPREKFSYYLSKKLDHHYTYLSNLFSEINGSTIEHFIITHKIEKVKELITYGELNLTEIAFKMNYSSVAHLSNQFKKITGLTPSSFKLLRTRSTLEDV